jgi:superfamily II DNA or RNA helicase
MDRQTEIQEGIIKKALEFFNTERFGYIDGAMRLGKIKIALEILKRLFPGKYQPSIMVAYPDNKIKVSWQQDSIRWGYDDSEILYTNFSSLHKYTERVFDIFIIDEFHAASPLERDYCQQIMTNSKTTLTLALSGTISQDTKDAWGLKEIARYTTLEGIADGILSDYQITVHLVELDTKVKTPNKSGKLLSEKQKYDNYSYVIQKMQREYRNFMHLALSRNRLSLKSLGKTEYLKKLLETRMKDKRVVIFTGLADVADSLGIASYHSKSKDNSGFQAFMEEKVNWLALAAMGKMGVTYPNLDAVILLNFTYNAEESSQILNRAIKLDYAGKVADLHIICLNEPPEIKKVKESLSMLDNKKIIYK